MLDFVMATDDQQRSGCALCPVCLTSLHEIHSCIVYLIRNYYDIIYSQRWSLSYCSIVIR